jgi:ubiquitin C-terminal hydrolase
LGDGAGSGEIWFMKQFYILGHYVCDVFDSLQNRWKCYNDAIVEEVGDDATLDRKRRSSGYLFFFLHSRFNTPS